MKVKFLATGTAPDYYEFEDEKVIFNGQEFDLSVIEEGDLFQGIEADINAIRAVERIDGELYVTLCQKAPQGHWTGTDHYIDSKEYDSTKLYIREKSPEEIEKEGGQLWEILS